MMILPARSQGRVRVVWYLLGTDRQNAEVQDTPAASRFALQLQLGTARPPWLPAALWIPSILSAAVQDMESGGL